MKNKNFIIPLVIYPFDLMVSIGESDQKLEKTLSGFLEPDDVIISRWNTDTQKGRYCRFSNNSSLLRLRRMPETPEDFGVLAHEVFHSVTHIMDMVGMKLKLMVSDEAYSYLVGFITEEIYKKIR